MVDTNEITGARLTTKPPTEDYRNGWDRIFGQKKKEEPHWVLGEDASNVKQENKDD